MQYTERSMTLHGAICGPIWWPTGAKCGKPIDTYIQRIEPRDVSKVRRSIFDIVADVCNDGDFQAAKLSADSFIQIEHTTLYTRDTDDVIVKRVSHARIVDLAALPSVADLVDAEAYGSDFDAD